MGIVTLPNDSNTGSLRDGTDEARGSYVYQNDKALADEINGNLEDANIKTGAGIAWSKINKSGSNLSDLTTKSHTSLTDIGTNTHAQIDSSITTTNGHIAATEAHGATGAVVGTTNSQTISNKTITSSVLYGQPIVVCKTLVLPEYVQDETDYVPVITVDASWAPYGITVIKCGISLDANRAYSVEFEDHSEPGTVSQVLATVATDAGEKEDSSPDFSTDVDAGHLVCIDLPPTTGAKFLHVWIVYKLKAS